MRSVEEIRVHGHTFPCMKTEVPHLEGGRSYWMGFPARNFPEAEKVEICSINIDEDASQWYYWYKPCVGYSPYGMSL